MTGRALLRELFAQSGFRRLLSVRLMSQLGDGVFQAGLAWLVLLSPDVRQSPTDLAAAAALLLLPFSLLGPFTGVFLDRWPRRQVLVWGQLARICLIAPLVWLTAGDADPPAAYVLAIGCLGVNRFLLSALSAGLPHVVTRDLLLTANAVAPTAGTGAFLVGTTFGAVVIGVAGGVSAAALVVAGVAYGLAAGLALRLARHALGPDRRADTPLRRAVVITVQALWQGMAHLAGLTRPRRSLIVMAAARIFLGLWTVYVYLVTQSGSRSDLAAVFGAAAVGVLVAAVVTPLGRRRLGHEQWLVLTSVVSAVAVAAAIPVPSTVALAGTAFVLGLTAQSLKICVDSVVQSDVGDAHVGRAFALYDVLFNVTFVAATVAAVFVVDGVGLVAPVIASVGMATTALWMATRR